MRIRMLTTAAGPAGVRHIGTVHQVDKAEAYRLCEAKSAEQLDEEEAETTMRAPAETATARPQRRKG